MNTMARALIISLLVCAAFLAPRISFASSTQDYPSTWFSDQTTGGASSCVGGYSAPGFDSSTQALYINSFYTSYYTCGNDSSTNINAQIPSGKYSAGFVYATSGAYLGNSWSNTLGQSSLWGNSLCSDFAECDTTSSDSYLLAEPIYSSAGGQAPCLSATLATCLVSFPTMEVLQTILGSSPVVSLSSLQQYKSDATTTISEGSSTTESHVLLSAFLNSSSTTSTLQLQIEVEPSSTPFTYIANLTSTATSSPGHTLTLQFPASDTRESSGNGQFQWQARAVDSNGDASQWITFASSSANTPSVPGVPTITFLPTSTPVTSTAFARGNNPPPPSSFVPHTDFSIDTIPLYTQATSSYPSLSNTTGTKWWDGQLLDNISTNTIAGFGCLITSVVMDLRSYGITTTTMNSFMSSTDVNPGNFNDWLENYNNAVPTSSATSSGYWPQGTGNMNWQDIPYYAETPSGTFTVWYNSANDHVSSASTTWVNKWLNDASGTIPVILTEPLPHFVVATGQAMNNGTTTYTVRDPFFYNTMYLNQTSTTTVHNYNNTFSNANILEPTSTTQLPHYLEYAIDGQHTLLITDPHGNRLGSDPQTGTMYNDIPNGGEDDGQPGVRFLTIYTPIAGKYTQTIGGPGRYRLYSFVADGKHRPIPQVLSASPPSGATVTYHQNYDPTNLPGSTLNN
jgi:hypothetical protein